MPFAFFLLLSVIVFIIAAVLAFLLRKDGHLLAMSLSGSLATGMIFRLMAPTYQGTLKIKTNVFELDAQVSAGEPSYGAYVLTIAAFYLLYVVVFRYLNYRDQRP